MNGDIIFYAHSQGSDKTLWQPLGEHLLAVAQGAGERGGKFGARNASTLAGLLHDLGKYHGLSSAASKARRRKWTIRREAHRKRYGWPQRPKTE